MCTLLTLALALDRAGPGIWILEFLPALQSKYDKVEPEGSAPLSPLSSVSVWSTDRVGDRRRPSESGERRLWNLDAGRAYLDTARNQQRGLLGTAEPAERASGYSSAPALSLHATKDQSYTTHIATTRNVQQPHKLAHKARGPGAHAHTHQRP